jgi:hypothetical protein
MNSNSSFPLAAFFTLASLPFSAHADVSVSIGTRAATATISVSNTKGQLFTADASLDFDNPQSLTAACLGLTADALDAGKIADIQARLPSADLSIDPAFPVRITITPSPTCAFSFNDYVDMEIHTSDLSYTPASPYRLYKGPVGGTFHDITTATTSGSMRARGRGGAFSEFVLVKDNTQDYLAQAQQRYADLSAELSLKSPTMASVASAALSSDLSASLAAFNNGDYASAASSLATFDADAGRNAGKNIANFWQPGMAESDNVVGDLVSRSGNIQFLLGRLQGNP